MGRSEVVVFDAEGREIDRPNRRLGPTIHRLETPASGRVEIRRR
jgi:hypothetical protein